MKQFNQHEQSNIIYCEAFKRPSPMQGIKANKDL